MTAALPEAISVLAAGTSGDASQNRSAEDSGAENTSESADAQEEDPADPCTQILVRGTISDTDTQAVVSTYGDVSLLSFGTEEEALEALDYYSEYEQAAERNETVYLISDSEDIDADAAAQVEDALEILSEADITEADSDGLLIALIDTGASEDGVYVDQVSVIDDDPSDANGHGTQMYEAITEVNPDAQILSIKAFAYNGKANAASVYAGIQYAIEAGADIINLSFSADVAEENSVVADVIQEACDAGIIVVGAAGNDGEDASDKIPGGIEDAYIFGALEEIDHARRAESNYGETVDGYIVHGSTSYAAATAGAYFSLGYDLDRMFAEEVAYETYNGVSEEIEGSGSTEEILDAVNEVLFETASELASDQTDTNYLNGESVYLSAHGTNYYYSGWSTRYKTVTDGSGNTYMAYCIQPSKSVPRNGSYTTYTVSTSSSANRMILAALLIYEAEELSDAYLRVFDDLKSYTGADAYYPVVHAAISYWADSDAKCLDSTEIAYINEIAAQITEYLSGTSENALLLQSYVESASLYKISISGYQDIMFAVWKTPQTYQAFGYLDLHKLGINASGTVFAGTTYSRSGAVYGVYESESDADSETNRIRTITTNTDSGAADAVRIQLSDDDADGAFEESENTVYVKEISAPSGCKYYTDTTVYTVNLVANGISDTSTSGTVTTYTYNKVYVGETDGQGTEYTSSAGTLYKVITDQEVMIPFTLTKYNSETEDTDDFTGTSYKIYSEYETDSSGNVETDENGMPSLKTHKGTISYSNGSFTSVNLHPGTYYIQETSASDGYNLDQTVYKLVLSTAYSSANDYYYVMASIYYCVSVSGSNISWKEYTDADVSFTGSGAEDLDSSAYAAKMYFTADTGSDGLMDLNLYSGQHGKTTAVESLGISVKFFDAPSCAFLYICKTGSEEALEDPVEYGSAYSLEGAVFGIYTDADCTEPASDLYGNLLSSLTTDESGATDKVLIAEEGTFYIKEILPSAGYCLNEAVYSVEVSVGGSYTVKVEEPVETVSLSSLTKTDGTGEVIAASGTQFCLTYYYEDEEGTDVPDQVLYYETDETGVIDFSDPSYLVESISTEPYLNSSGEIVFYAGKIIIEETKAPEDFALNDQTAEILITVSDGGALSCFGDIDIISEWKNDYAPDLSIYKTDAASGEAAGRGFTFLLSGTQDDGTAVSVVSATDAEGMTGFSEIRSGSYTITEVGCPDGYILDDETVYELIVDEASRSYTLTKVSWDGTRETLSPQSDGSFVFYNVPYTRFLIAKHTTDGEMIENVVFRLYSVSGMYLNQTYDMTQITDENGEAVFENLLPGTYYLEETDVSGALCDKEPVELGTTGTWKIVVGEDCSIYVYEGTQDEDGNIEFSDSAQDAAAEAYYVLYNEKITVFSVKKLSARDEETPIQGVTFRLYNDSYDCYEVTDAYGRCSFTDLTPGTYTLEEASADGSEPAAILSEQTHTVIVSYDSSITVDGEVIEDGYSYVMYDDLYAQLNITKRDSYSYDTVKNVVFKLTGLSEEVMDYSEIVSTDENGKASFSGLVPGTYVLVEMDAVDSVLSSQLDDDGNPTDDAAIPAVSADQTAVTVIVDENYVVYADGEELDDTSYTYTKLNAPVKGRVKVRKFWSTADITALYLTDLTTLLTQDGLNVYELPVIHLASDESSTAAE